MTRTTRRDRGWTLIELMTVLAVAGVLAAAAIPGFRSLLLDTRRATQINQIVSAISWARLEAAKRGQAVIVCGMADGPSGRRCAGRDWSKGLIGGLWSDANANQTVDEGELEILGVWPASERLNIRAGTLTATPPVHPAGTAVLKPFSRNSSNGTITVCDVRGAAQARAVIVFTNGRSRTSSRRADGSALTCEPAS